MRSFMRVEFSDGVRASNTRLVLMIELPGPVMFKLRVERAAPQARALEVALRVVPLRPKAPGALGEPAYTAPDGCRAGVIRCPKPFPGLA